MEPKFQTSFIPKKQAYPAISGVSGEALQKTKVSFSSLFMIIAVILFFVSVGSAVGAYFWKGYLTNTNTAYKADLAARQKLFDLTSVEKMQQVNNQIDTAKSILSNHIAFSKIFEIISQLTIANVRFMSLDIKGPQVAGGNSSIIMSGYGSNLPAVAFQSDILGRLTDLGLSKIVKNAIVSSPAVQADGTVAFSLSAEITPDSLSYEKSITGASSAKAASASAATVSPTDNTSSK